MDDLKHLVEYVAGNLVSDSNAIHVDARRRGQVVVIALSVPPEEMGKVIGRQGRIARSMRTLLTIAASRRGLRASLDIHE